MSIIEASTRDEREFFRVVRWVYNDAHLGRLLSAWATEDPMRLRMRFEVTDRRIEAFAEVVADPEKWTVVWDPPGQ